MADWPAGLPQSPLISGYGRTYKDNNARFDPDVGPGIVRQRSTTRIIKETMSFLLANKAQVTTFEDFYLTTLSSGSLRFQLDDPIAGTERDYLILGVPSVSPNDGKFIVSFEVEYTV